MSEKPSALADGVFMLILHVPTSRLPPRSAEFDDDDPPASLDELFPPIAHPGSQERRYRARLAAGASRHGPLLNSLGRRTREERFLRLNEALDMGHNIKPVPGFGCNEAERRRLPVRGRWPWRERFLPYDDSGRGEWVNAWLNDVANRHYLRLEIWFRWTGRYVRWREWMAARWRMLRR